MVKRAILHIGGEKTGTTTLQHFLTRNARLLRRQGIYYPCESSNICYHNKGHFPVAACLIAGDVDFVPDDRRLPAPTVLGVLNASCLATSDTAVLSCEHFSSRLSEAEQLETLRDAIPTDDIKVVFYAREPPELAVAAWSTGVRQGSRGSFDLKEVVADNLYFNHLATLDLWAGVFGRENIVVREYDRDVLIGGDIRWDFCGLLGVDLANPYLDEDENASFDAQRLEILRFINCALPLFEESPADWRKAQEIRNTVARSIPSGATAVKSLLCAHDAEQIKCRFRELHEELSVRYFDGRLSNKWFPSVRTQPEIDQSREPLETNVLLLALRETIIKMAEAEQEANARRRGARRGEKMKRKITSLLTALKDRRGSNALN